MAKALSHLIIGVLSMVQFIFAPINLGFGLRNIYVFAICGNMVAFLWCFGVIDLIIGVASIIQIKKFPDSTIDLSSDMVTVFLLIINVLSLVGSIIY